MKTMEDAIRQGKERFAEMPRSYGTEEQAIKIAVAKWLWDEFNKAQKHDDLDLLEFMRIVTK
jgi:hypothetical protein